jgi:diacylglycerol kinase family enzyme
MPSPAIAIVRNQRSGSVPELGDIERALAAAGVRADISDLPPAGTDGWLDAHAKKYDVLVAAGGDGTISTVANAAIRNNKTLAVLPGGTLNHFARDADIPLELDKAVALLTRYRTGCVDVGVVNERLFINNVSIGSYARMVQERTRLQRLGRPRRIASMLALARSWWQLRSVTAHLSVDGAELIRRSPLMLVGNGRYKVSGLDLGRRSDLSEGTLSLYVTPGSGRLGVLTFPLRALIGTLEAHEEFEVFEAASIGIHVAPPLVRVAIDGEVVTLKTPLQFHIRKKALRVLLPVQGDAQ